MSGIPARFGLGVTRMIARFVDPIGGAYRGRGTGFWVRIDGIDVYVTNRHTIDLEFLLGKPSKYRLDAVQLELRRFDGNIAHPETRFFEVSNLSTSLRMADTADCAILYAPEFTAREHGFEVLPAAETRNSLADERWLADKVHVMDVASFVGFPGKADHPWWDEAWNYPIARSCTIASPTDIPFTNHQVKTSDVTLVAGFSFGGSSGSPVIAHEKGLKVGPPLTGGPEYVPAKVIGIMSGHLDQPVEHGDEVPVVREAEMFRHTGLSYFTRSTSILDLLRKP